MKKCEKCGAENTDTLAFCTNCGAPLLSSPTPAPAPAPAPEAAAPVVPAPEAPVAPVAPETPAPATPAAPETATPAPEAPAPMPAPTADSTAPATPNPSTIPTPTPVNPNPVEPVKKPAKNNKLLMIILIAAVAVIGIAIAVVLIISNNNNSKPATTTTTTNTTSTTTTDNSTSNGDIIVSTTEGTNVTLGDYTLVVPKNLNYELSGVELYLGDASESWMAVISYDAQIPYANVAPKLSDFVAVLTDNGTTVLNSGSDTISGQQYSYVDYSEGTFTISLGFFKAPNGSTFLASVTNGTAIADHGLFGITTPILLTAKDASTASKDLETTKIGNGLIKKLPLDDTSAFDE